MSETILEIQDVETYYGKIHALRGISFSVQAGEIVTLLGANGAGKSTTLRTISGLNRAARGSITFMGQDITRMPPHDIVAMGLIHVPEGRRVFKGMTIKENLELGSFTLNDDTERRRRMDHVFEMFPVLYERRQRDAALLSGGEQQMLAMGRALMADTKVLLLDEPSMGLAPTMVQSIMKIIKRLNAEGVTILLVEQNAKAALKFANYGYVLETGSIVVKGEAEQLRKDESIVKAYLGE
ncbi:ABC transporter ATP-binding protein [Desulfogranum japonicum]|uniref:ABC transporter ATP-binding protein n=1 Tax=Desulfogranum japonicum TaxID=231447 RepID=UPI000405231D|nr:ABC transporter ATP-binding protein [Desulfogranum japonicum]